VRERMMASRSRNGLSVVSTPAGLILVDGKFIGGAGDSQLLAMALQENGLRGRKSQAGS
jgi:hypothetical protein